MSSRPSKAPKAMNSRNSTKGCGHTHKRGSLRLVERYVSRELLIQTEILYGNRANEIVRFAHENDIDLIVLSSHRIDAATEALGFGTISYKVGILAHCPVMMVK